MDLDYCIYKYYYMYMVDKMNKKFILNSSLCSILGFYHSM